MTTPNLTEALDVNIEFYHFAKQRIENDVEYQKDLQNQLPYNNGFQEVLQRNIRQDERAVDKIDKKLCDLEVMRAIMQQVALERANNHVSGA